MILNDITLCASGDCPLRAFCERSPGVETEIKPHQSVTVFAWDFDDDDQVDCDAFVPRSEWEGVE